ncbi:MULTISPECIES: glycosyltransferase family 9 protein [Streptomyces]|uniref:glycosyltransferase family 9 protein n=2 Tax=Streptomyces TaxID=1883 RepID=UPI003570A21F
MGGSAAADAVGARQAAGMTAPDRTAQPVRPASSSCAPSGSGTSSPVSPRCAPCGGPTRGTDSCRPPAPDSRRSRRPRGPWTGCCPPPPSPAGPSRAPSTGPARPPDIAVGLHGNGPPSHRLLLVLRPLKPPPGPAQDRRPVLAPGGAQTLLRAYGIDADPGDLLLPRPRAASPAPGAVVLHPGAGSPRAAGPSSGTLPSRPDCATVACGSWSPAARPRATWWPGSPRAPVCRTRTCPTAACLVRTAVRSRGRRLAVISGDTGIAHLAVAHGTRSIALSGPVAPSRWGPPAHRVTAPCGRARRATRTAAGPTGSPAGHRRGRPRSRRRTAPRPAAVEGSAVLSRRSTGTSAGTRRTSSGATARRTPRSHPART